MAEWRPPAPDPWVRRLLELFRAGVLLGSAQRVLVLAGGRVPQLEHLKIGACRTTNMVKDQKSRGIMKNPDKTTYGKSHHSHLPRAAGGTFFPVEDPSDLWCWSPAADASGGRGGACDLCSVGDDGCVAGCRVGGGGGGVCCLGGGRRVSSGLLSGCCCCGGGGGALLCSSAPTVFWRLGAGSPTREPSPRWSLRDLLPSAWQLRAGAAP
jgi:hypothetical protein